MELILRDEGAVWPLWNGDKLKAKSKILIWGRNALIALAGLVLFAFILFDAFFGFAISNGTLASIRQVLYANTFDDTYRLGAAWPIEGGQPVILEISYSYKQQRNTVERIIRCHQERLWGWRTHRDVVWRQHMSLTSVVLDDGALLLIELPRVCDPDLGRIFSSPQKFEPFGIWYLNDAKAPSYLIRYGNPVYNGGIALSGSGDLFNPRSLTITASVRDGEVPHYTSNDVHKKFGWAEVNQQRTYHSDLTNVPKLVFTALVGEVYVRAQFEKNIEIQALIKNTKEPVIIPFSHLYSITHNYRDLETAIAQFSGFLSDNGLEAVRREKIMYPNIHFTLTDDNVWRPNFSTIGIRKYYHRTTCSAQDNCYFYSNDFDDEIKFGSTSLSIHSRNAVYLPDKKIIIRPTKMEVRKFPLHIGEK